MDKSPSAVLQNILQRRHRGEQALLTTGAMLDDTLAAELLTPGSDHRGGVNIIVCPPSAVIYHITRLQHHLRAYEPHQYYYPATDLHLTVLEICFGQPLSELDAIAASVITALPLAIQAVPVPHLGTPLLGYDARACALNFIPLDQSFVQMREKLVERLAVHGVHLAPRYPPQSAHVTFMRYVELLQTPTVHWVAVLKELASAESSLLWTLNELWVTWGATWYGKQSRINRAGPYILDGLRSKQ